MDGTEVGVLKQTNKVSLTSLLKGHDGRGLESEVSLEILSNFPHQTLEWQFPNEEFSGLLVSSYFTESDSSWPVPVGLLDTSSGWSRLPGSFGGKLLPGSLSSSGLASCLLSSCHLERSKGTDENFLSTCAFIYENSLIK